MKTRKQRFKPEPLSNDPQKLGEFDWYYEEKKHVTLIHEVRDKFTMGYIRTDVIKIPWPKLLRSVRRKYKI